MYPPFKKSGLEDDWGKNISMAHRTAKDAESDLRRQIKAHSYSCSICMTTRTLSMESADTTDDAFQVSEGSSTERPVLVRALHLIRSYALSSPPRFLERWLG
jgi:hypothetical protein